jgi:hypothetical protein
MTDQKQDYLPASELVFLKKLMCHNEPFYCCDYLGTNVHGCIDFIQTLQSKYGIEFSYEVPGDINRNTGTGIPNERAWKTHENHKRIHYNTVNQPHSASVFCEFLDEFYMHEDILNKTLLDEIKYNNEYLFQFFYITEVRCKLTKNGISKIQEKLHPYLSQFHAGNLLDIDGNMYPARKQIVMFFKTLQDLIKETKKGRAPQKITNLRISSNFFNEHEAKKVHALECLLLLDKKKSIKIKNIFPDTKTQEFRWVADIDLLEFEPKIIVRRYRRRKKKLSRG